ncbi:MAG: HAMP domain-containing sensor histidine kinase [Verrucomicrobiales bacterium]
MIEFFENLFSTDGFPPRWQCGDWSAEHGWLHIVSDLMIFGAYFAIPLALFYFIRKRKEKLMYPQVFWLFGAFILSCGLTHLIDASIFFQPWYRLSGLIKLVTAVVSWWTVIALMGVIPAALQLPGLAADLNRRLQDRIGAQERAERLLALQNEELSAFAAAVTHDVKTPLYAATLFASLAKQANEKGDVSKSREMIVELEGTLKTATRLIDDIHSYAKIEQFELPTGEVPLNAVFEELERSFRELLAEKGAELIVEDLPAVLGDESALHRIFSNLIANSIKYCRFESSCRIEVRQLESSPLGEGFVRIEVADNGIGIAEEDQARIFEPFWRAKKHADIDGSGLGLAVCRRVARRLDGEISVDSVPGEGTSFFVDLPAASISIGSHKQDSVGGAAG